MPPTPRVPLQFLVEYLTGIGFRLPDGENPADWMIDVCSGLEL